MKKLFEKTGKARKILALVLTFAMVLSIVQITGSKQAKAADPEAQTDAPAFAKNLYDNGDGTYTLSLSVTGESDTSTIENVNKANVILVLDTSSSMNGDAAAGTTQNPHVYYTVPGTPTYSNAGVETVYYRQNGNDYSRLYYRNGQWRTTNSNDGTIFTGQFYARSRFWAEYHALTDNGGIIDSLLAQNTTLNPDIIEIAIASFGGRGATNLDFSGTSNTNAAAIKNVISGLSTTQGTNWEEGLQQAHSIIGTLTADEKENETTYVVFLTDGQPTTHAGSYNVNQNVSQEFNAAKDDARTLVDTDKAEFFGVFTWGDQTYYQCVQSIVGYAYTGTGNYDTGDQGKSSNVFNATSTQELINALKQIADTITNNVGYTDTGVHDGVTSMTSSSVKATAQGDVTGLKYYRSGGDYGTANPENGNYGTEWTDAPHATVGEDGVIDWELGEDFDLEDGVTYTMTFVVWPKQESLDLVADLNNGIISYEDLTDDQKSQISGSQGNYKLKTNTDFPSVSYKTYTQELDEDGNPKPGTRVESEKKFSEIDNPDPVSLAEEKLNALKIWEDSLDPSQREDVGDSVTLYLMVDGHYYYVDEGGNPVGVTLLESEDWEKSDYIAIAPGIMVTENSPAYDPNATQVTYNGVKYALIEEGHDYVFEESKSDKHFELTAYHHHPMIMGTNENGSLHVVDVIFTYDGDTITGIEKIVELTDSLSATNTLKGGININKKVVDENGEEINDINPFTITVTMTDPDGNALPTKTVTDKNDPQYGTEYTIDYRIFYGPNNPNYNEASGGGRSDHIYKTGTSFDETIYVGDVIRVVNVEDDTIYTVTETAPTGYEYVSTTYEISYGGTEANRKEDPAHQVQGNSASYAEVTNKYTFGDLEVSKVVEVESGDEEQAKDKEFTFTFKLYADDTKAEELTGLKYKFTKTDAEGTETTGEITEGGTFTLKDGETYFIEKLPEGAYYEITEAEVDGFETEATGATGTIVKNETAEAEFTNTYSVEPVIVDPPVKKDITGNEELYNNGDFTFVIANTAAPEGVTAPMPTNASITNSADYELEDKEGYYEFGEIEFTVPGTYTYTVTESGHVPGVTNDTEATKTITFTVTDNGEGALVVDPTTDEAVFEFTNEYKTGELEITKTVVNTADPEDDTKFTFTVTLEDGEGEDATAVTGTFPCVITDAEGTETESEIEIGENGGTVELANGESAKITELPDGVTYTVTEEEVEGYSTTSSGDSGKIAEGTPATAAFTNTYSAEGEVILQVTKAIEGAEWPTDENGEPKELTFTLTGTGTAPMPEEDTTVTMTAVGTASFGAIALTNTDAGKTYTYTISEDGFGTGWTGSGDITATVVVSDDGAGNLTADVSYDPEDKTITNTYEAEGEATIQVTKAIEGAAWPTEDGEPKELTFTIANATKPEGVTTAPMPATTTTTLSAPGIASFGTITYDQAQLGTYTYTITEDGFGAGWTGSPASITATVVVTDNGDGTLATNVTYNPADKTITNTYVAAGEAEIKVTKELIGAGWPEGKTLTFTLTSAAATDPQPEKASVVLTAEGEANFGKVSFDESDAGKTYTYTISEGAGFGDGWSGSGDVTATVKVTDNGDGTLNTEVTYTSEGKIINTYVASGEALIEVNKVIEGADWPEDKTLTFTLAGTGDAPMPTTTTASLTSVGKASFEKIKYNESNAGKSYTYTITEDGFGAGWTGSPASITATVEVTDNGDGTLGTKVTYTPENDTIINTYEAEGSVELTASKELVGRGWLEGETVEFTLYGPDGAEIEKKTIGENGTITFTAINYTQADMVNPAGGYFKETTKEYTIKETSTLPSGVTKSADITATVTITDNGNGTLGTAASYTNEDKIINTYVAEGVEAEIKVTKEITGYIPGEDPNGNVVDRTFNFSLKPVDGAPMPEGKTELTTSITTVNGKGGPVSFERIPFTFDDMKDGETQATKKVFKYEVTETAGTDAGFTYDDKTYTVEVTVEDKGEGKLEVTNITKVDDTTNVNVINEFKEEETKVQLHLTKYIEDTSGSAPDATFTFVLEGEDGTSQTKTVTTTDLVGTVDFDEITYTAAGTYNYTLTEIPEVTEASAPAEAAEGEAAEGEAAEGEAAEGEAAEGEAAEGEAAAEETPWVYDTKVHTVVVTVTDNFETAELGRSVTIDGVESEGIVIEVTNTYIPKSVDVALEVTKEIQDESGSADYETVFTFELAPNGEVPMPASGNTTVTVVGEGTGTFDPITYTHIGDFNYTITETSGGGAGWTNDMTAKPVVVTISDNNGVLEADVKYNESETSLTVTNIYEPTPAKATPGARKVVDDKSGSAPDEEFEFQLIDSEGTVVETVKSKAGPFDFSELSFPKVGTYNYTIKEVSGSTAGFTYDTEGRDLQIVVSDPHTDGILKAELTYLTDEGEIVITNPYEPEPTSAQIDITKELTGMNEGVDPTTFHFVLANAEGTIETVEIKGSGTASFTAIDYTKVGTYTYTVTETNDGAGGYTYDTAVYTVEIVVSDEGGKLAAAKTVKKDGDDATDIIFENSYAVLPTEITIDGTKVLEGRDLKDGEFTFTATMDGKAVATGANDAEGKIVLGPIEFTKPGDYTITVTEDAGELGGVTYDTASFEVSVKVVDNGDGTLTATATGAEAIKFINTYEPEPTKVILKATKQLTGRELKDKEFNFTVSQGDAVFAKGTNDKDGNIVFDEIELVSAGTYKFTLKEVIPDPKEKDMTYDENAYEVTVIVKDDGKGNLYVEGATELELATGVVFKNSYTPPQTPPVPPTGDNNHMGMWMLILALAIAAVLGLVVVRRRRA